MEVEETWKKIENRLCSFHVCSMAGMQCRKNRGKTSDKIKLYPTDPHISIDTVASVLQRTLVVEATAGQ